MNYQNLTPSEKALLKPLLARKLGTSPGKLFDIKSNGKTVPVRCIKLQFSWARESIDVIFAPHVFGHDAIIQYTLTVPFMKPIEQGYELSGRPTTHHHRVADRVVFKDKPRPRNVDEIIELLKDTDAYEILREDKLSRRDIDVTTRTIARITGMLETMVKGEHYERGY